MMTSERMRGVLWGVVIAIGLAWTASVSYGAWRGHLAAGCLARTIEAQQRAGAGAGAGGAGTPQGGPQPPTAPPPGGRR